MIIAVDIGNTNIVLGCIEEKILFVSRITTNKQATQDEYAISINNILKLHKIDPEKIDGAIISSVVPAINNAVYGAVKAVTSHEPLVVGPGIKTGLNIKLDNPAQLGSDRVVGAVAAIAQYPKPIIVIDMGTATTFCAINELGEHLGGIIYPGVKISLDALTQMASNLSGISLTKPKKVIGSNTADSMKSGILYGNASMIDGMIDRFEEELGKTATIVATGGLSETIIPFCKHKIIFDNDLLLKGLKIIYDKNVE